MPDNSLGEDQSIPTPRGMPVSGNNDFGVHRALDGHRVPEEDEDPNSVPQDVARNIHMPDGGYGLVEVALALLIVVIAVVVLLKVA